MLYKIKEKFNNIKRNCGQMRGHDIPNKKWNVEKRKQKKKNKGDNKKLNEEPIKMFIHQNRKQERWKKIARKKTDREKC